MIRTQIMDINSKQCWHHSVKFGITSITLDLNFQFYKWDRIVPAYPKYTEKITFLVIITLIIYIDIWPIFSYI